MIQQPESIYINESGLYTLLIKSKSEKAKKFNKWLTGIILPKLRIKNAFSTDDEISKLLGKINELEKYNNILLNDLKAEKFPEGAMVYITEEIDVDGTTFYRIGKTNNLNKRLKVHNTHVIHNKKVVHYTELKCPLQLEECLRSLLYKYKYKNKKDYFKCPLAKIIKAFNACLESIACINEQSGGSGGTYVNKKLIKAYSEITL